MRGDPPTASLATSTPCSSTPHARGSTVWIWMVSLALAVYPACAGIHLAKKRIASLTGCLPRMRGDPPVWHTNSRLQVQSTPHARGSTRGSDEGAAGRRVYPACAGIHLNDCLNELLPSGLPRMRGDPPIQMILILLLLPSTPHARGSTAWKNTLLQQDTVYPACAGIHPPRASVVPSRPCLPRMRGDPPGHAFQLGGDPQSTPHARGSTR